MIADRTRWWAGIALLPACLTTDVTAADSGVRLSLDHEIDGRAATTCCLSTRVTTRLKALTFQLTRKRLAGNHRARGFGQLRMGLADINSFIKFRDSKRDVPIKAD